MTRDDTIAKYRAFVAREGETLGRLLAWAERRVLEATLARLNDQGDDLTMAQIALMQQLCLGSSRQSELARRMGLTKQAVGQIADTLERRGLIARVPDPADSRAKAIEYTPDGLAVVGRLLDATQAVEREIADELGGADLRTLKATLTRLTGSAARDGGPED